MFYAFVVARTEAMRRKQRFYTVLYRARSDTVFCHLAIALG